LLTTHFTTTTLPSLCLRCCKSTAKTTT
jgi:hypothetical protein